MILFIQFGKRHPYLSSHGRETAKKAVLVKFDETREHPQEYPYG